MKDSAIKIKNLKKEFVFKVRDENKNFFVNLFSAKKKRVQAVNSVNLEIKKGERVAFIGPNGAGKSTTIKMLTGILFPTSGKISVLGFDPQKERKKLAYKVGTVFGQRSQMFPNLPFTESMYFFGVMYDLPKDQIKKRIDELSTIFNLNDFKTQPVRKLSLGQRMRAEIACAMIHKPEIIFLDEPTIGLDVVSKKSLRDLLLKLNKETGTTIFLTSHDVGDIENLCERTIIINHGQIVKDMPTQELTRTFVHEKYVDVFIREKTDSLPELVEGIKYKNRDAALASEKIKLIVDTKIINISDALKELIKIFDLADIAVYDVELEEVIRQMYVEGN